ncbi:hypothetical protein EYC84_007028 [Monilinia fructicola]|uniref:Uncharacterized protein n=1 Tax=Monilinia fructicola TaxID=38448 RepID=A0A5M9KA86_MONFR|nr:hypothetical protein EYC84_007028 [Monilinia fructicola]
MPPLLYTLQVQVPRPDARDAFSAYGDSLVLESSFEPSHHASCIVHTPSTHPPIHHPLSKEDSSLHKIGKCANENDVKRGNVQKRKRRNAAAVDIIVASAIHRMNPNSSRPQIQSKNPIDAMKGWRRKEKKEVQFLPAKKKCMRSVQSNPQLTCAKANYYPISARYAPDVKSKMF